MNEKNQRAKDKCILCGNGIDPLKYLENGNFCLRCSAKCGELAHAFPYEIPNATTPNFEHKLHEWSEQKESYKRLSKLFQKELKNARKANSIKK